MPIVALQNVRHVGGRYELAESVDEDASVFHYQASRLVVELSIANHLNHFPEQSNFTAGEREREREGERGRGREGRGGGGGGGGGDEKSCIFRE